MFQKVLQLLSRYNYAILAIGLVTLVQFLPYYLEERQLLQNYSQYTTGTVLSVSRNIFGNARPAHREEERSCTLIYRYQVAGWEYQDSYRHNCAEMNAFNNGDPLQILYDVRQPSTAKPAMILLNYRWLKFGTGIGALLSALGVLTLLGRILLSSRSAK